MIKKTILFMAFLLVSIISSARAETLLFSYFTLSAEAQSTIVSGAHPAYPILINNDIFHLKKGDEVSFSLPGNERLIMIQDLTYQTPQGGIVQVGYLKDYGKNFRVFLIKEGDVIRGNIKTPEGPVKIKQDNLGQWLVDQRNTLRVSPPWPEDIMVPQPGKKTIDNGLMQQAEVETDASKTRIDIMILYTAGLAANYPGDMLSARFNELIAFSNAAYEDSGVDILLNLVHFEQVNYSEDISNKTALEDLTQGNDGFSEVSTLREQYGADLVTLIRPFSSAHYGGCGIAWLNGYQGADISRYADSGYSSVLDGEYTLGTTTYFCSDYSLTHELGHNMGCAHDRENANDGTPGEPYDGAYPYSYGHGISGRFGTIMSYINPELPYFSNPDIDKCDGEPCGVAISDPWSANNALTLNNTKNAVAAFQESAWCADADADTICDDEDNCVDTYNPGQEDSDNDGIGDACDTVEPVDLSSPDGFLILTNDVLYPMGSSGATQVYGTAGTNHILVKSGAGVIFSSFTGNNVIYVDAASTLFSISRAGATVTFMGTDGTVFTLPATAVAQTIAFSDGAASLVISDGQVLFDGKIVAATSSDLTSLSSSTPIYTNNSSSDLDKPDAYLLLNGSLAYTLNTGSATHVYGNNQPNNLVLEQGALAKLFSFSNENEITLYADFSNFAVSRSGATVTLKENAGTTLIIPATLSSQILQFEDQRLLLRIDNGQVMLGEQVIP